MSSAHRSAFGRGQPRLRGPLSGLPPEAKLVGLVAFLVVVAVTPPSRPWALAGQAGVALAVATAAMVTPRDVARRLVIDLPLVVLAATMAVAGSGPRVDVAGTSLSLSRAGLRIGLALLAKATIGIVSVSAAAGATTASETVAGLRRLRLPAWLCDLVAMTARQVQVLGDELGRLRLAGAVRAGTRGRRGEWSAVARSLGVLFVRSVERGDRLQVALAARGGGSTLGSLHGAPAPTPESTSGPVPTATTTPATWLAALVPAAAALALRLGGGG